MLKWEKLKLQNFLSQNPNLRLKEFGERVVIEGYYALDAQLDGYEVIQETYNLQIVFPKNYPKSLPIVIETENRIPRNMDFHTYKEGPFCLGSDIKLKSILFENPSFPNFEDKILKPFLYSVSYKLRYNLYPFGELAHGEPGLIDDYQRLFEVEGKNKVLLVLTALGRRKRDANKLCCPCSCGLRIGKCEYRFKLQQWRYLDKRRWFRDHLSIFTPVQKPKKSNRQRRV